jgi:hypothetical protein
LLGGIAGGCVDVGRAQDRAQELGRLHRVAEVQQRRREVVCNHVRRPQREHAPETLLGLNPVVGFDELQPLREQLARLLDARVGARGYGLSSSLSGGPKRNADEERDPASTRPKHAVQHGPRPVRKNRPRDLHLIRKG